MFWGCHWMPAKVQETVFDYLGAYDLLKASCVSKAWYEYIALSHSCMEKITVNCGTNNSESNVIKKSIRKYTSYRNINYERGIEVDFLSTKSWKYVVLELQTFPTMIDYFIYLNFFAPTVEELIISYVMEIDDNCFSGKLEFQKLKSLYLFDVSCLALLPLLMTQPNLHSIKIGIIKECEELSSSETLFHLLNLNKNSLKMLHFEEEFDYHLIGANYIASGFKIRKFIFDDIPTEHDFIHKFVNSQHETLTHLDIYRCPNLSFISKIWNSLHELKCLTIGFADPFGAIHHETSLINQLNPNPKLDKFEIYSKFVFLNTFDLMKLMPNLKTLKVKQLTKFMVNFLKTQFCIKNLQIDYETADKGAEILLLSLIKS